MSPESVIIRCDQCGTKNRVPNQRLNDRPVCGKCRALLPVNRRFDHPVIVTDQVKLKQVLYHLLDNAIKYSPKGGLIVGDERLCPAVTPDIRLTSYQRTGRADRDKRALLAAARGMREKGFSKMDACTPFPIHGMPRAMGLKSSKLPWVVLVLGLSGAAYVAEILRAGFNAIPTGQFEAG